MEYSVQEILQDPTAFFLQHARGPAPPEPPPEPAPTWWGGQEGPASTTWRSIPESQVLDYKPTRLRMATSRADLLSQLNPPAETPELIWFDQGGSYPYKGELEVYRYPLVKEVTLDRLLEHPRLLTHHGRTLELPTGWCARSVRVGYSSFMLVYPEPANPQTQGQRVAKRRANQIARGQIPTHLLTQLNHLLFQVQGHPLQYRAPWNALGMNPLGYRSRDILYRALPDLARAATVMRGTSYRTRAWRTLIREAAPAVRALRAQRQPDVRRFGRWLAAEVRACK